MTDPGRESDGASLGGTSVQVRDRCVRSPSARPGRASSATTPATRASVRAVQLRDAVDVEGPDDRRLLRACSSGTFTPFDEREAEGDLGVRIGSERPVLDEAIELADELGVPPIRGLPDLDAVHASWLRQSVQGEAQLGERLGVGPATLGTVWAVVPCLRRPRSPEPVGPVHA
jgi:hypothetical protein